MQHPVRGGMLQLLTMGPLSETLPDTREGVQRDLLQLWCPRTLGQVLPEPEEEKRQRQRGRRRAVKEFGAKGKVELER